MSAHDPVSTGCQSLAKLDGLIEDMSRLPAAAEAAPKGSSKATSAPKSAQAPAAGPAQTTAAATAEDTSWKFDLVRSVGEECVAESELKNLLAKSPSFNLYDGFEPSGRMHIAQGIFKAMNVNKCTKAGGTFIFWVADWFALMNDKMGGDLDKIKKVGEYLVEVWKAAGMNMERVKFVWASEAITQQAGEYWPKMLDIARSFTVARIKKCCQIMGRKEGNLTAAQILYPLMQCTDVFFLKAHICQLGVDQRKVNMLAREYCEHAGIKLKPIILSHHMLYGLGKDQAKMSKSDAESAIFMEDTVEDVTRKLQNAYCPAEEEGEARGGDNDESMHLTVDRLKNPCLDYVQHIIFCAPDTKFVAGGVEYCEYESVRAAFLSKRLSEADLKQALVVAVNGLLEPVRHHFATDQNAKEILALVRKYKNEPSTTKPVQRCMVAVPGAAAPIHAVFAPSVTRDLSVSSCLDIIAQLKAAHPTHQKVLWFPDWSSFVLNCLGGDMKAIKAGYKLLLGALRALSPALLSSTTVLFQSDAILTNPSDYWISVINVGRHFDLELIREVGRENEQVGQVISELMHVGDVQSMAAAVVCGGNKQSASHSLALRFLQEKGMPLPELLPALPETNIKLKDVAPGAVDPDAEYSVLDNPAADAKRKLKKAFCEPGNTLHNPVLVLAQKVCLDWEGHLQINRSPDNGGEKKYTEVAELEADFQSGSLHPGDLKPAVAAAMERLLNCVTEARGKEEKDAEKVMKNWIKNANKKKK